MKVRKTEKQLSKRTIIRKTLERERVRVSNLESLRESRAENERLSNLSPEERDRIAKEWENSSDRGVR